MPRLTRTFIAAALWVAALAPASADAQTSDDALESGDGNSLRVFQAPNPHRFAVYAGGGKLFWDTAYGSRASHWNVSAGGRFRIVGPLITSVDIGYSRRAPEAGPLVVANNHLTTFGGIGAGAWLESLRLEARALGGLLTKFVHLDDDAGTKQTLADTRPAGGAELGVGVSLFGTAALTFYGGGYFYAPERLDMYLGIRLAWLFVPRRR